MEKRFIEGPETHPDILHGGHRYQYQLENAIKSGGIVFCYISLGLNSLPGSCEHRRGQFLKHPNKSFVPFCFVRALGTIHLQRQYFLGGESQKLIKFANV